MEHSWKHTLQHTASSTREQEPEDGRAGRLCSGRPLGRNTNTNPATAPLITSLHLKASLFHVQQILGTSAPIGISRLYVIIAAPTKGVEKAAELTFALVGVFIQDGLGRHYFSIPVDRGITLSVCADGTSGAETFRTGLGPCAATELRCCRPVVT